MTFEVKRSEWIRGQSELSALLVEKAHRSVEHPGRKKCCLGFFANACGISDSQIKGIGSPASCPNFEPEVSADWNALMRGDPPVCRWNSDLCNDLMSCNDTRTLTDDKREAELTKLFSKLGHTVEFVD